MPILTFKHRTVTRVALTMMLAIALALGGCGMFAAPAKNTIAPQVLTKEQTDIIDLVGSQNDLSFFTYNTTEAYQYFDVWVEVYKDGKLMDTYSHFGMMGDDAKPWKGEMAVSITQTPDYIWNISVRNGSDEGVTRCKSAPCSYYDAGLGCASSQMQAPAVIEDGKEIVLYSAVFAGDSFRAVDEQEYVANPDILKDYPYVHLIKCRFGNTEMPEKIA